MNSAALLRESLERSYHVRLQFPQLPGRLFGKLDGWIENGTLVDPVEAAPNLILPAVGLAIQPLDVNSILVIRFDHFGQPEGIGVAGRRQQGHHRAGLVQAFLRGGGGEKGGEGGGR